MTDFVVPRCATCGRDDSFEHNDDYSYIKCNNCGREYFGGRDELLEYNQDVIDEVKERLSARVIQVLNKEIRKKLRTK
jgi:hypothetical protein